MMWKLAGAALAAAAVLLAQTASGPIPSTFFAMTSTKASDFPKVSIGTLGHPSSLAWQTVEQTQGVYKFDTFDSYVNDCLTHGLFTINGDGTKTVNMQLTLGTTPQWAASDQTSCTYKNNLWACTSPPSNFQDWTEFLTALLNHYNGRTQPHMRYYELWNEFNASNYWTGTNADMLNLAKAAYPIVHADPYSMLLTPSVAGFFINSTTMNGATYMANYLKAGGSQYADGGAWHGYIGNDKANPFPWPEQDTTAGCSNNTGCFGSIITKATVIRQVFDANGLLGKPMYQTEGSWGIENITSSDDQIAWLARWYLLQAGLRISLNLQLSSWFAWGGALYGNVETATGDPTPAALADTQVYQWLVGASINQPCSSASNSTWTCTLTRPNGYVGLAVWNTAGTKQYTPGAGYTQYRDLAGDTVPIPAGGSVTIGAKPILVEGTGKLGPPGRPGRCPPRCPASR
jgi:hypothetical protein